MSGKEAVDSLIIQAILESPWLEEDRAAQRAAGAAEVRDRVEALADEWRHELDSRAIRDENARFCWNLAETELRAALKGDQ